MGAKYRHTISYTRGQSVSTSPFTKHSISDRNTSSVSQRLPTSFPDSTYPVSQRVSYTSSIRFQSLTFPALRNRPPLPTDSGNCSRIVPTGARPPDRLPLPRKIIILSQTLCACWICAHQPGYPGNETQMPESRRGGSQGRQELRDRYACHSPPLHMGFDLKAQITPIEMPRREGFI